MKEFELIQQYFAGRGPVRKDVVIGVGDDAAVTRVANDQLLVVATDTMVENVHFFKDACPRSIGHRCLAVNLSDFAAMGAEPAWASVALTLPNADEDWLKEFSDALFEIAEYYNVQIVGGDTTQGPLCVTVSLKGFVPEEKMLLRSGAKNGDWIYVTGALGESALAVDHKLGRQQLESNEAQLVDTRFNYPKPRLAAGQVLRHCATSAIDVSDGLIQDLTHILKASNLSAHINVEQLPVAQAVVDSVEQQQAYEYALMGGEDYELIFTVPEELKGYLEQNKTAMGVEVTCIGQVKSGGQGINLLLNGEEYALPERAGYQHFAEQ